ncbi:periplasmic heavy metal sensor [Desulfomicrobium salsuginis]
MKSTRNIIIALALFLAFAGTAMAMNHGNTANLTPEKQAVVDKAHDDFTAATADLKRQIFAKESALDAEIYGDKTDDKKVEALVAEINALNGKIYAERVKLQKTLAKEGILPGMGHGMMGGKGGCQMMGGGMMSGGMQHGAMGGMQHDMSGNGTAGQAPAGHAGHGAPAQQ